MTNLATLYQRLGRDERALELYLQLRKSPLALTASEEARLLGNLGALYRRLGDPIKALALTGAAIGGMVPSGHAQFRSRPGRRSFVVEVQNVNLTPGTPLGVFVTQNGMESNVGTITLGPPAHSGRRTGP
ncbi:MAG: tetratricopeptide repeat protein [Acidobacteria bacterium]|nr:tetratricopeptide repeat protein [Acidobacteriota bacterium]